MRKFIFDKTICLLFIAFLTLSTRLASQSSPYCRLQASPAAVAASNQPTNCITLLNDFVPGPNDSTLEIKVKMWVFAPSTLTNGVWTRPGHASTLADAQAAIDTVNMIFASMPPPIVPVPGVTSITNAKIKLVLDNFVIIQDDAAYSAVSTATANYLSPNHINLLFGDCEPTTWGCSSGMFPDTMGAPAIYPLNSAFFRPNKGSSNPDWDNVNFWNRGNVIAHEVAHILGLDHVEYVVNPNAYPVDTSFSVSFVRPSFGCCNFLKAQDFYQSESKNGPCFGVITGTNPPGVASNNLVNYNGGCPNRYLSPQQVALIHYTLRTSKMNLLLTPKSYMDAMNVNHGFDYNVTSNETWTSDRYFKGDITVKAGKVLTIKCGLAMTRGAKIIVEKTALLVVDGGTITSITGWTWDGIHLQGDPNNSQAVSLGMPVHQGMVKLNHATISHAKVGVRNHFSGAFGGIVSASHSSFINNACDVEFIGAPAIASHQVSVSKFFSCHFKTTGIIGNSFSLSSHVSLNNSSGIWFYGCNFEDASGTYPFNHGTGIYSVDSKFNVDQNGATRSQFKYLERGIYVNNTNPLRTPVISNSDFRDNLKFGAYFMNVNYLSFKNNSVHMSGTITPCVGMYMNSCKYYTLKNNVFEEDLNYNFQSNAALEIFNSGPGAHQVYKNTFSNSFIGINAMGDNSGTTNLIDGLKMNCNNFTQAANKYDIGLNLGVTTQSPSVMTNQGVVNSQFAANPIRNMYAATCVNNNQNKWYIHSSSTKAINHGCNATSVNGESTKPDPQPACSRTVINISTISGALNYTLDCVDGQPSGGGNSNIPSSRMAAMSDYLGQLLQDEATHATDQSFEIQATHASRLNLFLSDSLLQNPDSVIALLQHNAGRMSDADVQLVFAYIDKGDYAMAQDRINLLATGSKPDWASLLGQLLSLYQDTLSGLYQLNQNTTKRSYFLDLATAEGKDGQYIAKAVLKAACDSNYTEPHNYPEGEGARRSLSPGPATSAQNLGEQVAVFPNPASNGVNVLYISEDSAPVLVELRDLVGKLIYTNFITGGKGEQYIPVNDLSNGMYLLTLSRDKKLVYTGKLIKAD